MSFKHNFTLFEFEILIRREFGKTVKERNKKGITAETYQEEAGRIALNAREYFFEEKKNAEERAKEFPGWLADIEESIGDFDQTLYTRALKFNNNTIDTLKRTKADAMHSALVLHYRLHMYYNATDRQFADDLDRQVFGGKTFEQATGKPVFT
ncbi:hypothetical protein J7443_15855 [Tropicibacter sp. R15_0]|uniref:hypothetical protein n=1 Tax=Tropicibacter sp. R15_0 TaxID=2821101 RepID=UPI001AD999E2|nr:hypothetical protein [Tropicibacter sp. R15_0]MBO9466718.1 hypothetical protein [Tropicibacter sp. R15_0]